MLDNLSKGLFNAAMAGVGAVAILAEKTAKVGKICMEKGAETLERGRVLNDELRRKGEQVTQERRERLANEALERLTAQEREALRQKLADLDAREVAAQAEAQEVADEMEAAAAEDESTDTAQ